MFGIGNTELVILAAIVAIWVIVFRTLSKPKDT
jgi:hypothetical protein